MKVNSGEQRSSKYLEETGRSPGAANTVGSFAQEVNAQSLPLRTPFTDLHPSSQTRAQ